MNMQDIYTIEQGSESELDHYTAIQRAINSGHAWSFQGSYGRAMMDAISAGLCMLGKERARDYWGNTIPSRYDVKEGTKGSRDFVAARNGEDWAEEMENA